MTTKRPALPLIALGLLLFAAGCGTTEDAAPTTFAEATAQAAAPGVPRLLEFFTAFYSQVPGHVRGLQYLYFGLGGKAGLAPWMWVSAGLAVAGTYGS